MLRGYSLTGLVAGLFRRGNGKVRNLLLTDVFYINGSETLPAPLDGPEEEKCIMLLGQGDEAAKKTLIEHNLRLVVYIARKFENTGVNIEDLISIGTIGLIKAVNTFCADKNIKLATYSSRCIENEILMYLRKNSNRRSEISIEEPLNVDWDGNALLLSDVLGTDADEVSKDLENRVEMDILKKAVSHLNEREKKIMTLRFGLGGTREYTQKQVADMLGISQSYISRLEKKILLRLKNDIEMTV